MTRSDPQHHPLPDKDLLLDEARPEQIRRLLDDIRKTGEDGFPPVQGTA
mgnify:FL=1